MDNGIDNAFILDFQRQFLTAFAGKRLLRRLARLNLTAHELP